MASLRRVRMALAVSWVSSSATWASMLAAPAHQNPAARPRLGMNLNGPADWNTELPFVDAFRLSRTWISQKEGAPWGKGPELALDERAWVKSLEPGTWAETLLSTIDGGHYPASRGASRSTSSPPRARSS